ncbi:MAG: nucleotide exchange factor GrpE [Thermoanaerobaculia bacterium]
MTDRRDRPEPGEREDDSPQDDVVIVEPPTESLEEILSQHEAEQSASGTESLRARLEASEGQIQDLKDAQLRKLAEFENFKKRTEREKTDYFRFALADFFRDLLPVLDNFERALAHSDSADDEYRQGVALIYRQLTDALKKRGLTEVESDGPFDPNIHEAVARGVSVDKPPNTILQVLQKGYYLNDRLLRPAFVKVAAPPTHDES